MPFGDFNNDGHVDGRDYALFKIATGDNITTIGGIIGDIVSIKDNSIVIETTTDRVRVEFAKFAVSTNNTAEKEAAKQKAAALAARKEQKEKEKKAKKDK